VRSRALTIAVLFLLVAAPSALAAFPYSPHTGPSNNYADLYADPGQTPGDLSGNETWMYSATAADPADAVDPEGHPDPALAAQIAAVNANPTELNGVRGAHIVDADAGVQTAWQVTTGRPDVVISVLDSGIKWNDSGVMNNVRFKIHLNAGELPTPRNDGLASPNEPGENCQVGTPYTHAGDDDLNGDGVFNLRDFSCDNRVSRNPANNVNPGLFEPQDLLIAFSDGSDADSNGYVDDIAGWDFLDDDNDAYDDVQYGHGSGEIQDSTAEAGNVQGGAGTCPNCTSIPLRVGDSFIADVNRFAAAVTYATDNGVSVIQEALGSMNNSGLARQAVDYAYRHGTTVIASAADEAAQHNNWPSSLPHVIMVNSVTKWASLADSDQIPPPVPNSINEGPPSYLKFNGCTNFYAKLTVAIPSVSCSSDATGRGSGIAGLIYSAALDAVDRGKLSANPHCTRVDGTPCPITPNEVRQLMASGTIAGQAQADDVNFSQSPEPSCSPVPSATCTDPFLGRGIETPTLIPVVTLLPQSKRYPARAGHDQFYGYGRVNVYKAVDALMPGSRTDSSDKSKVPPEVEITSPEWYSQNDPEQGTLDVRAQIWARGTPYTCQVLVAPGHYPNNASTDAVPPGDFKPVGSSQCDGSSRTAAFDGVVASLDLADLESRFPPQTQATGFTGREPGGAAQTSSGRPNTAPYGFVVKVVAATGGTPAMTGEDRRAMYLHRDADMLDGFPRTLPGFTDGESSPAFADLDGDNRNELILGSSNGIVHAYTYDPATGRVGELPGWPVRGDVPGFVSSHTGSPAFATGAVDDDLGGAMITAVAVADADHDGVPEVYAGDLEGKIYGWDASGARVFRAEANPAYSGKPQTPFVNVRNGHRNRTQHGFLGSPVLADLDKNDGGKLEIIAAGMDRHVYAWENNGDPVPGFPVLVVDPTKVGSVDPVTHRVTFNDGGDELDSGGIVDTPAVGDIGGDERPEIIVGTNEEYAVDDGTEGPFNVSTSSSPALGLLAPVGLLDYANGRLYAIKPDGDPDAPAAGQSPYVAGRWPAPIGIALSELLPVVGEGINGSPVIAPLDQCASGDPGPKIGTIPAAGLGYLLNADGSSCLGSDSGLDRTFDDGSAGTGTGQIDRPVLPAVGLPAFGDLGGSQPSFVAPAAGVMRALDLALNEYQTGGQDFVAAWDTASGDMVNGYPTPVNDLSFLTGPAVGDVGGLPGEEIVAGTSSMDLVAVGTGGVPASTAWPKLTTDWTIATPLLGSFGTLDTDPGAPKVVVNVTRSGMINAYATDATACSPSSSPRFHHDNANSGDYRRDAVLPGAPSDLKVVDKGLEFNAPGDDLLCGTVAAYEVVTSQHEITPANFDDAQPLAGAPAPAAAGSSQAVTLADAKRYVAIRAADDQGNVGRPAVIDLAPPTGGGGGGPVGGGSGTGGDNPGGTGGGDAGGGSAGGGGAGGTGGGSGGTAGGPPAPCANEIAGTTGGDKLAGTAAGDHIVGRGGDDRINGAGGDDCVAGEGGNDRVRGGAGGDELRGGRGRDRLAGGAGDDVIRARKGSADRINCGAGDDTVYLDNRRDRARHCETIHS
jgi:hypothetical protein